MSKPDTGYEASFDEHEHELDPVHFHASIYEEQHASEGVILNITRNLKGIGIIRTKTKEEARWMIKKINGTFTPRD